MFGIQAMGSRLWDARGAMAHATQDAANGGSISTKADVKKMASLKKLDIAMLAFVAEIIALGLLALSIYGCCSMPSDNAYLAPAIILAFTALNAAFVAIVVPFGAKALLQKREEALANKELRNVV